MSAFWLVCTLAAGGCGALARFWLDSALTARFPAARLPVGILVINLAGSFAAGAAGGLLTSGSAAWQLAVVGCLGAFTTFSTVMVTLITQWLGGHRLQAALYLIITVAGTLALAWAGLAAGSALRL